MNHENFSFHRRREIVKLAHPIKRLPANPPMHIPDAIHETSLVEIGPDSSGVFSDFRIGMLALVQPHVAPKENASKSIVITHIHCRLTLDFLKASTFSTGARCKKSDLIADINYTPN
jgi:hypothetical protein